MAVGALVGLCLVAVSFLYDTGRCKTESADVGRRIGLKQNDELFRVGSRLPPLRETEASGVLRARNASEAVPRVYSMLPRRPPVANAAQMHCRSGNSRKNCEATFPASLNFCNWILAPIWLQNSMSERRF
jgi:hypothetical protein